MEKHSGLEKIFFQNLRRFKISPGDKVLVALSGGLDSMCLLHLALKARLSVSAFHYNYGLRGIESSLDQLLIEKHCQKHGIPLFLKIAVSADFSSKKGIQAKARDLRYNAFDDYYRHHSFKAVFTAHHADDIAETMLMNLARGAGISGLKGIPVSRAFILRPLFNLAKSDILNYASNQGLTWREDASNYSDLYTRNIFRNKVIPGLENLMPQLKTGLSKSARQVSEEWENFQFLLGKVKHDFSFHFENFSVFKTELFCAAPEPVALGLRLFPEWNLSETQWQNLVEALSKGRSGAKFFSENHEILVYKNHLFFRKKIEKPEKKWLEPLKIDSFYHGNFQFMKGSVPGLPKLALPKVPKLFLKNPEKGDLVSFGNSPSQSLIEILHQKRLHPWMREEWPVFCDQNFKIVAVPGIFGIEDSPHNNKQSTPAFFSWLLL